MRACEFPICGKPVVGGGLCDSHYAQRRRGKELTPIGSPRAKNIPRHLRGEVCAFPECGRIKRTKFWCETHRKMKQRGEEMGPIRGQRQYGTGSIDSNGYVRIFTSVGGDSRYRFQHRLVMEDVLGRPLHKNECVHHRNGNRADNRPENLELWVISQPAGQRPEDLVAWAREIIERYE